MLLSEVRNFGQYLVHASQSEGTGATSWLAVPFLLAEGLRSPNLKGDFAMIITWVLFALWLIFNVLDIIISVLATQMGAIEIGLLYQITGTWLATAINKTLLAILIGLLLVYLRKNNWLSVLNLGILGLCLYNGCVLLMLTQ
jgi:hypothetical protein